ncbi:peptidylprolyl isomerase/FKBP-type peptidyl-prolyl cis-trans isomerase SlpA [Rhodothalassium salexigens DSM 2132]|uniref:Peptidyl-prolyl cis-trans isomerase n=1 Tax=Rhodothalassium salexigens DSM 2132 TaxID=1188247 RepID=A0A4R2P783_RHOSA|nr:peptidylprolyl isomerase [Rhodothalassium salexigens]MBB4212612.1 FKBP-type peptidyl-prolyl cis-trans isomerase 2 [Rhodothalassium salexigens DSM 2132]MBK1639953.1 peptidylprolyl isomerase [Rhodothalassium salexigens DSM 2132]TCP30790.1 peptidylprolyl isomerase/FKBP-type peptidyl-prolyl cis-trans isomerase SlpA [Rhodothalassium salexigens DSM 2132]
MAEAKTGDRVSVHYKGTLDDGQQFDNSRERDEPIDFVVGDNQIIAGFEDAVKGMTPGDTKAVRVEAEDAYGERRDELVFTVPKSELPDDVEVQVGSRLQLGTPDGQSVVVTVTAIDDDNLTLDANHMLAGKALNFEIELVDVQEQA